VPANGIASRLRPSLSRSYGYFDAPVVGTEMGVLVDKAPETMAGVKDRDQFYGAESE